MEFKGAKLVIAVSGWKRSGKDMIADHLTHHHGFCRLSFADALKIEVSKEFGLSMVNLYDQSLKETALSAYPVQATDDFSKMITDFLMPEFRKDVNGVLCWTPRAMCIQVGSARRSIDPNFWVTKVLEQMEADDVYVIPDLRYRSEVSCLKKALGDALVTIRIDRWETVDSRDPSEHDLDDYAFDYRIDNRNSSKETVFQKVSEIVQSKLWGIKP